MVTRGLAAEKTPIYCPVARYQCEQILGESFYRLDVNLGEVIDMDDGHKIERLVELANQQEEAVEKAAGWVEAVCGG